jgi:hypothetical protein
MSPDAARVLGAFASAGTLPNLSQSSAIVAEAEEIILADTDELMTKVRALATLGPFLRDPTRLLAVADRTIRHDLKNPVLKVRAFLLLNSLVPNRDELMGHLQSVVDSVEGSETRVSLRIDLLPFMTHKVELLASIEEAIELELSNPWSRANAWCKLLEAGESGDQIVRKARRAINEVVDPISRADFWVRLSARDESGDALAEVDRLAHEHMPSAWQKARILTSVLPFTADSDRRIAEVLRIIEEEIEGGWEKASSLAPVARFRSSTEILTIMERSVESISSPGAREWARSQFIGSASDLDPGWSEQELVVELRRRPGHLAGFWFDLPERLGRIAQGEFLKEIGGAR